MVGHRSYRTGGPVRLDMDVKTDHQNIQLETSSSFWQILANLASKVRRIQRTDGGFRFASRRRTWNVADTDISGISLGGFLGATLAITTPTNTFRIRGLKREQAQRFYESVRRLWIASLNNMLDQWHAANKEAVDFVDSFAQPPRYVRTSRTERHRQALSKALEDLPKQTPTELRTHPVIQFTSHGKSFVADPIPLVSRANEIFVEHERQRCKRFFDTIESNPLSDEQQLAVVTDEDHNLVVATAGSGKDFGYCRQTRSHRRARRHPPLEDIGFGV